MQGGQNHSRRLETGRERRGLSEMGGRAGNRFPGVAAYDEDWDDDVYYETSARPGERRAARSPLNAHHQTLSL